MKMLVRDQDKFMLRLPDGMRERVQEAARAAGRPMNTEIVLRLEASFENPLSIKPELLRLLQEHIDAEVAARLRAHGVQPQTVDGGAE